MTGPTAGAARTEPAAASAANDTPTGTVTVVGLDGGPLGGRAMEALARATFVVGWPRHVELVRHLLPARTTALVIDRDLPATLAAVAQADGHRVVLASGDPGYFGIVGALSAQHGDVAVVPAVSSIATAFARAGLAWDDAHVVSAHGRPSHHAIAVCRRHPKVAVLTEPGFGPAELGSALAHLGKDLVVAERLGHPDERVTRTTAAQAAQRDWTDPNVVIVLDAAVRSGERGWSAPPRATALRSALADDAFEHRGGLVTKAEVRALVLAWMGPGLGDLVWDVGTGSGSVAVEAARLGAAVVAVDDDPAACELTRRNAERHAVPIDVVRGRAPGVLADLPDPDVVFVGGGGHLLTEIVRSATDRARRAVVVALDTVERVAPTRAALEEAGLEVEVSQVQGSRLIPRATGHHPAAGDPVFVLRGARR
jgi:precorrin-6B C5,15-methyltransferase / cobalt-precorrin-6B C5,C15-methyltransferase